MHNIDGIGQCVIRYDYRDETACCGMTFFQCGRAPLVILTDLGRGVSVTNSIESAASFCRVMHFLHVAARDIMFFEHYHRPTGEDEFFSVKMTWDGMEERYVGPEFSPISQDELHHLISCYGYREADIPQLSFKPAKIIEFKHRMA